MFLTYGRSRFHLKIALSGLALSVLAIAVIGAVAIPPQTASAVTGATVTSVTPSVTLYVATNGSDQNTGTSLTAPLATLERAVALAKSTYKGQSIAIRLRAGWHTVSKTVFVDATVGPLDIGPYNNEAVTLSGALVVSLNEQGTKNGLRLFTGSVPASVATSTMELLNRQSTLRVNGGGSKKARFPNTDYLPAQPGSGTIPQSVYDQAARSCPSGDTANLLKNFAGDSKMAGSISAPTSLPPAYDLSRAYINIFMHDSWGNALAPVRKEGTNLIAGPGEPFSQPCLAPEKGSRYFLENIPQALDASEEFYIDTATRTIEWLAPPGLPADQRVAKMFLPINGFLLRILGGGTRIVWGMKVSDNLAPFAPPANLLIYNKGASVPAIEVDRSTDVTIRNMSFTYVGTAVGVQGSSNVSIKDNTALITYGAGLYAFGSNNVLISNNSLNYIGITDKDARGMQGGLTDSLITGNYIDKTAAAGITCAACVRTTVSYNMVREAASDTSDTGALHTGGTQDASIRWQGNYVFSVIGRGTDANGVMRKGVSSAGFYPDTGANHQTFVGNIIAGYQQHDALGGMFDNEILSNLLIGYPKDSATGSKVRSFPAYESRTTGTLTVKGNFAFVPASEAGKYAGQTSYGGMPMLVHSSNLAADASRILASDNSFVKTRALTSTECKFVQSRVNALAPYMRPEFCTYVANDLSYLKCGITAPTTCATKSSVTAPLTNPSIPSCTVSVTPTTAIAGQNVTLSWQTQNAEFLSIANPTGITASGLSGSVTIQAVASTTVEAEVFGAGGYASCKTNLSVRTGTGSITGTVFLDANRANFTYDSGETTFANRTVVLSGPVLATTTTDASGRYAFKGLVAGSYRVIHEVPAGYVRATDDNTPATLASDSATVTIDFGIRTVATTPSTTPTVPAPATSTTPVIATSTPESTGVISGTVFTDIVRNSAYDAGDTSWSGRTVTLTGTGLSRTTTTDAKGEYVFSSLPLGIYRVAHVVPEGYLRVTDDSYYPIELTSAQPSQVIGFGFVPVP